MWLVIVPTRVLVDAAQDVWLSAGLYAGGQILLAGSAIGSNGTYWLISRRRSNIPTWQRILFTAAFSIVGALLDVA